MSDEIASGSAWGGVPPVAADLPRAKSVDARSPLDRRALEDAMILSGSRGSEDQRAVRVGELQEYLGGVSQQFQAPITELSGLIADPALLFRNAGLSAPEIVDVLPETGNFPGRLVFLTVDNKLYRWTGTEWTAAVPAVDIIGQLTNEQIEAIEAAKLTGQIAETQISDDAITTPKIAAGAVSAAEIAAGAVVADKIATNAITAVKIAAGAIEADKIAGNSITGDKIVANTITGGLLATSGIITQVAQIGDGLITNAKIADAAITRAKIGAAAIGTAEIANGAITNALIGNAAITSAKIGDLQVNSAKIADLTVGTEKITGNAVTSAGAAYGSIGSLTRYVWTTVASLNLSTLGARVISFTASGDCLGNNIRILVNGVVVRQLAIAIRTAVSGGEAAFVSYFPGSYSTTVAATSTAGSTLLQIQAYKSDQEYTGSADGYITAIELKK